MKIFMFFRDGGVFITYPILVFLLINLILWIRAYTREDYREKGLSLIAHISWFALAWGYLGRTIGLIGAFDKVAAAGDIAPSLLAGGLKMALLGPLFGLIVFLLSRLGIIALTWTRK